MNTKDRELKQILKNLKPNSPEEEAEIQRQIAEDEDTWEFCGPVTKRGRPLGRTKKQVTVSLDIDLIEALSKPERKGWQTRLNAAARAGLGLKAKVS